MQESPIKTEPQINDVLEDEIPQSSTAKRKRKSSKCNQSAKCFAKDAFKTMNDFRKKGFLCDFEIKTGRKVFKVHRSILAARSSYFKDYFTVNTKQNQIDFRESATDGVQKCIEYIYTDNISINLENVEAIFNISMLFKLEEVSKNCCNCLVNGLTIYNCLVIKRLAEKYKKDLSTQFGITNLDTKAERFAVDNLKQVICTEMFGKASKQELIALLRPAFRHSPSLISNALLTWVSHDYMTRSNELTTVFKAIDISRFTHQDLLQLTCNQKIISSPGTMELLCYEILRRNSNGAMTITCQNWADVRELAIKFNLKEMEVRVNKYVLENFAAVTQSPTFYKIDKFTLNYFLQAISLTKSTEKYIWDGIIKWTKYHEERQKCFPEVIKNANLSRFSFAFIKNTIKNEPLINQDNDCLKIVIEALCSKAN